VGVFHTPALRILLKLVWAFSCQCSKAAAAFVTKCPWADSLKPAERLEPVAPSAVWKVSVHIGAEVCGDIHMGLYPSQR
jgi:hypothetical protein